MRNHPIHLQNRPRRGKLLPQVPRCDPLLVRVHSIRQLKRAGLVPWDWFQISDTWWSSGSRRELQSQLFNGRFYPYLIAEWTSALGGIDAWSTPDQDAASRNSGVFFTTDHTDATDQRGPLWKNVGSALDMIPLFSPRPRDVT